jgi:uncharacterized protein (TIGR03437 family)
VTGVQTCALPISIALRRGSVYLAGSDGSAALAGEIDPAKSSTVRVDSIAPVVVFPPPFDGPLFGGVVPGQMIQIRGSNLGPVARVTAKPDATGHLPFVVAGTIVFFDNVPAPLVSVDSSSITCFVPFEVVSSASVTVSSNGQSSSPVLTGILPSAPQVLSILNQDGSLNSAGHPARAGSVITLYVTGLGKTNPPSADGLVNASPLPSPVAPVTVYFPTTPSAVTPQLVIAAAGMVAGITEVDVQLPASIGSSGTRPLFISVNSSTAQLYTAQ